jgi:oligopeptide/dipeptide ABC transporter ATP-binding protein
MTESSLLEVRNISVSFVSPEREVQAVRDCSLSLRRGEALALVGESGSGKSTLARVIAGITTPAKGALEFHGRNLASVPSSERRALRRRIQMVFQDPDASLNPFHRVGTILAEPLQVSGQRDRAIIRQRVAELLALVRLDPALLEKLPRELSGGQKQRFAIARALAMEPEVLIADEPLAALDVSTAAAIRDLFRGLMERLGISMLFVSHDLATVRRLATRVAVMFAGEIVEHGPCSTVLASPAHPYTQLLLAATPDLSHRHLDVELVDRLERLEMLPETSGACSYRPRCVQRAALCTAQPGLTPARGAADHLVRCHFRDTGAGPGPV